MQIELSICSKIGDKNLLNNSEPENARKAATQLWAELKIGVACVKKKKHFYTDFF